MPNENWVCFDCRVVVRRKKQHGSVVAASCPGCGRPCRCMGMMLTVPPKSDEKAWNQLRTGVAKSAQDFSEGERVRKARERHALEQRIAELERLPRNKDRNRLIKSLQLRCTALRLNSSE